MNIFHKIFVLSLVLLITSCGDGGVAPDLGYAPVSEVVFKDKNLEQCVKDTNQENVFRLSSLTCYNMNIADLDGINNFTNLSFLSLTRNPIVDISPIEGLKKLINLEISATNVTDLSSLSELRNLTKLRLSGESISDYSSLLSINSLRELVIINPNITQVSELPKLVNLTDLRLNNYKNDTANLDLTGIEGFTKLEILSVNRFITTGYSSLSHLVNLKKLYFNENDIVDPGQIVSAVEDLVKFSSLSLIDNNILDISSLSNMHQLEVLNLSENDIVDYAALSGMLSLKGLFLRNNNITNIDFLFDLRNQLEDLFLNYNNIHDITILADFKKLSYLRLDYNHISDVSVLSYILTLKNLNLDFNDIGGEGIGNVDDLVSLTNLFTLRFDGNNNISCSELNTLHQSEAAVFITPSEVIEGVNCSIP